MVLNRHQPEALLVHLADDSLLAEAGIRLALAAALFREQGLSLGQAARFSGVPPAEFICHVSRLDIPVVRGTTAKVHEDTEAIVAWRNGSSPRKTPPDRAAETRTLQSMTTLMSGGRGAPCGLRRHRR